jgi:DNA helicase-2/ATP-dependent DNA helicase PcrA
MAPNTVEELTVDGMANADDEHGNEWRMFGPPGTGKTTSLSKQIRRAVERYGSKGVLVASFTRTAAEELAGRRLPIHRDHVATLHAHAYRALGKPTLAETPEVLKDWNQRHPDLPIGSTSIDAADPYARRGQVSDGDRYLMQMNTLRARMIPRRVWPPMVSRFARLWDAFKADVKAIDFTDMIELALRDVQQAPGAPHVGFFDEAQDFTALELTLARQWARHMAFAIYAGDDDQCLYAFKGAYPEAFLNPPLPASRKRVLAQSYRVPAAVHKYASRWIMQVREREPKEYRPRHVITGVDVEGFTTYSDEVAEGRVRHLIWNKENGETGPLMDDVEAQVEAGRSVMLLATCGYILLPLKNALRERGLLFHNPYNRKRGDWNPLGEGKALKAVLSYCGPSMRAEELGLPPQSEGDLLRLLNAWLWTKEEFETWVEAVNTSGFMRRGAKKRLLDELGGETDLDQPLPCSFYSDAIDQPSNLVPAANGDLKWLMMQVAAADAKRFGYLARVAGRYGRRKLLDTPRITLGTIHSVKGGQADVVYVLPDVSNQGMNAWAAAATRDEVVRQFYVAFTRAKEELVLCEPGTETYIRLP